MRRGNIMNGYEDLNLYWGDLHCHVREERRSRTSSGKLGADGPWTLDEVYAYGREVSQLDFVAITDHDVKLSPEEWADTMAASERHTCSGEFIAFLGYEWSHVPGELSCQYGHRNIIYRHTEVPLLSCGNKQYNTAPKLWRGLKNLVGVNDIIVIPHHPSRAASWICWNHDYWDNELERLVEVYSLWGSSEKPGQPYEIRYLAEHSPTARGEAEGHFVQDALARGYRFGLVAGSESHDGRPGNPIYHGQYRCGGEVCYHGGIQGTYSTALGRDELFDAFRARRCYGTTGVKIELMFSLNGAPMGSELPAAEIREIQVTVLGADAISQIDIVRNNEYVYRESPSTDCYAFGWCDIRPSDCTDYYYIRVTQEDGNIAWSSPIWVGI